MPLVPAPPGFDVGFDDTPAPRFAPPSAASLFVVGLADRGTVGQSRSLAEHRDRFGGRVNYSVAGDAVAVMFGERAGGTVTFSRVTGPGAVASTITLNDAEVAPAPSLKVTAPAPGASYDGPDGYTVEVTSESTSVRVTIRDGAETVVASPLLDDHADLVAWAPTVREDLAIVEVVGDELPAVTVSPVDLAGGDDDRTNITTDEWAAAAELLDPRFGPGLVLAPGVSTAAIHRVLVDHAAATGRLARLDLDPDVTEQQAGAAAAALLADRPATAWRGALWASWAYAAPVPGEPERLVPYSAIDAGVHSRILGETGIGSPTFGPAFASSLTATRLYREWTTTTDPAGEVQRLYAGRVNVAIDRGSTIAPEGYRTLDPDERREDLATATTRMALEWRGGQIALSMIGSGVTWNTIASYNGRLADVIVAEFSRALNPTGPDGVEDGGYRVSTDRPVNAPESMAQRHMHARTRIRPAGSTHWVDLLVGTSTATEQL
ncbi:MAG: hypothetical protein M0P31_15420 [Solirubrobacteraceae bacterium]|nr:hypothetical protein [Solirubrobacteraceae bacterium]